MSQMCHTRTRAPQQFLRYFSGDASDDLSAARFTKLTSHPVSEIGIVAAQRSQLPSEYAIRRSAPKCSAPGRRQESFMKPSGNIRAVWSFQAKAGCERQTTKREFAASVDKSSRISPHEGAH
jgi:hypothetical protein